MTYKKGYTLKEVDYITLDLNDSVGYKDLVELAEVDDAINSVLLKDITWNVPLGAYSNVVASHPNITTVEVVSGVTHINTTTITLRLKNGIYNNYCSSGETIIGHANLRGSQSLVLLSAGEFLTQPKPSQIAVNIENSLGFNPSFGALDRFIFTLKFCYYEKD